jgi:hypothetical protein
MELSGLHLLLTYQCNYECEHCFVWGSPKQEGVMTGAMVREILAQARRMGSVRWLYFEGGEPFLYYALMLRGVQDAAEQGLQVGAVTNAYWAVSAQDALDCLRPMAGLLADLSISSDLYHGEEPMSAAARWALQAARELGIPAGVIQIAQPEVLNAVAVKGTLPHGLSRLMYRGRAAARLAGRAEMHAWDSFTICPHEDLADPGRVHIDPFGYVHLCQGLVLGNLLGEPLPDLCAHYHPEGHPVVGPLLEGGPAGLVAHYKLDHAPAYADACHLCDHARRQLRPRFPQLLAPDGMYGPA